MEGFRSNDSYKQHSNVVVLGPENYPEELLETKVGVLKVDVEGAELDVFKGMFEKMKVDRPYVLTEILPAIRNGELIEFRMGRQKEIAELFEKLGYRVERIGLDGGLTVVDLSEPWDEVKDSNFLLSPQ